MEWFNHFLLAWIPLFVAIDPIGMGGLFLSLTADMDHSRRKAIARQGVLTGLIVALSFMFIGDSLFKAIGITLADFQIAGGFILLIIATKDLLGEEKEGGTIDKDFGIVPMGLPLIAGPAMLSAQLVLMETEGVGPTVTAVLTNMVLVYICCVHVKFIIRLIGHKGVRAISKIISLLLVAIAINMMRRGIQSFF